MLSRRSLLVVSILACAAAFLAAAVGGSASAAGPANAATFANARPAPAKVVREQVGARTATSRTYLLSDGTKRTRIYAGPVNYRKADGSWGTIDTTLKPDGTSGDLRTAATGVPVELPQTLADPVRVTDPAGRSVAFRLKNADAGATARPTGATATYAGVQPGVDATYEARSTGVKETLTLADASAPSTFTFALDPSAGLTPSLRHDGSVALRDAKGAIRFVSPSPTVQDADANAPTASHVAYALSADGSTLTLTVDPEWLKHASFPVKVDPSYFDFDSDGCTLSDGSLASTPDCGDTELRVGYDGTNVQRAAIRFSSLASQGIPKNASVSYAQLYITLRNLTNSAGTERLDVAAAGRQLEPGATWNTYDGVDPWDTAGGDFDTAAGKVTSNDIDSSDVGIDVGFDITTVAASWVHTQDVNGSTNSTNNGLLVKAHDETRNELATFGGPTYPAQNQVPALEVDWTAHTGVESDQTYATVGIDDRSDLKVNVATGNMAVENNDINIPGVDGMDLDLSRTYNSEDVGNQHILGSAWSESLNGAALRMNFDNLSHSHVLYANGGAVYRFDNGDANLDTISRPNLVAPPATSAKMTESTPSHGVTVTWPNGTVWTYGSDYSGWQELQQIKDAHGNTISLTYSDPADSTSLSKITDSYGHDLRVNRDPSTHVVTGLTDATGRTWQYALGGTYHNLDSYTNPDLKVTRYTYDTSHPADIWDWMSKITDARGHDIVIGYTGATGDWQQVTSITRVVDGGANDVRWSFDYDPAAGFGHSCTDSTNLRTVETDPRGKLTTYCSDSLGHVGETWDALGRRQAKEYDPNSNVSSVTTAAGGTANPLTLDWARDSNRNLNGGREASGATFGLTYCADAAAPTTNACGDGVSGALAQRSVRKYTDEQGIGTDYDYNATGDLTRLNSDQNPTVAGLVLAYNTDGTLATSRDPNGNTTTYSYTNHNLTTISPAGGGTLVGNTTMTYDPENRVRTLTDGLGTTATVTYDGEDRPTSVTYSNNKSYTITYDNDGNPTQRVEKNGTTTVNTTTYTYDNLNRRTGETFPGSLSNGYEYDKLGNLVSLIDPMGTTTYRYDDISRLTSVLSPKLGTANCVTSPTSCDAIGYAYADTAGSAAAHGGATSRTTATFPGSTLTQVVNANASGDPTSIAVRNHAGTVLQGFAYTYRQADGTSQQAKVSSVTQQPANLTTTYGYGDSWAQTIGMLRHVTTTNSARAITDQWTYNYDVAGNRTSKVHFDGTNTTTTTYAYNAANQVCWSLTGTSANGCSPAPSGATGFAFDRAGNQTSPGSLSYDAQSRLTRIGTNALSYLTPSNQELVAYGSNTYHNNLLGLDRETISGVSTDYTRLPDGSPIAQRTGTAKQYLLGDRIGSITALADDNADSLTRTYAYDTDGNRTSAITGTGSGAATDLGLDGGHLLPNNMYHFGVRVYDPSTSHWTQQDPLNLVASQQDANRYDFAGGDPMNLTDLTGASIFTRARRAASNFIDDEVDGAKVLYNHRKSVFKAAGVGAAWGGAGATCVATGGWACGFAVTGAASATGVAYGS